MKQKLYNTSIKMSSLERGAVTRTTSSNRTMLLSCASLIAIVGVHQAARAQQAATPIPDVSVNAPAQPLMDGSAAAGYRVQDSTAAGPIWGDLPVQDTPYSIGVIPAELLQNTQASQLADAIKLIPQISENVSATSNRGNNSSYFRGFASSNPVIDGLNGITGGYYPTVEDKESVQLLSGASGFLYGLSNSFGGLNSTLKRPTATPYFSVTGGDNAGANGYVHADLGGPLIIPGLTDGLFGYRLNLVEQGGNTSVQNMSIARNLESVAIDVHPSQDLLIQFNASHAYFHENGNSIFNGSANATNTLSNGQPYYPYPAPGNPQNGEPAWAYDESDYTTNAGVKVSWKLNNIFTLRSEYQFQEDYFVIGPQLTDSITSQSGMNSNERVFCCAENTTTYTNSGYAFLDAKFSTFGLDHKVTTGFSGDTIIQNFPGYVTQTTSGSFLVIGQNNYYNGIPYLPEPALKNVPGTAGETGKAYSENYILGDEIKYGDKLVLLGGMNYTVTGTQSFLPGASGSSGPFYALTPTGSIVYKILPWLSAYATYQEGLSNGQYITNTSTMTYTNAGSVIPAYVTHSLEGGVKATVGTNILLTASIYNMDQPNSYAAPLGNGLYTYEIAGTNNHKGIELTAQGKLTPDLTLVGGFNAVNARVVSNPGNTSINNNMPEGVSPLSGKVYAEYTIPYSEPLAFLKGLTLIGGFQAASWYYFDEPNMTRIPGHITGDLGFRYATALYDHPLIIRFNVNNITNAGYYVYHSEGPPRTFLATAELKW